MDSYQEDINITPILYTTLKCSLTCLKIQLYNDTWLLKLTCDMLK